MSNLEPVNNRRLSRSDRGSVVRPAREKMMRSSVHEEENEVSFKFLLNVWNQWWKWLVPVSLMMAIALAAIVMMSFKPKYRASASINIAEQTPWLIQKDVDGKAQKFVATQIEMLRSPLALSAALDDPKISRMKEIESRLNPVEWLKEKGLEIQPIGQSTLIEVAFAGVDPDASAHLVNTVIDKYFSTQSTFKTNQLQEVIKVLNDNRGRQEKNVQQLQRRVKLLSKDLEVIPDLSSGNMTIINRPNPAQDIMDQIRETQFDVADLRASVSALQSTIQDPNSNYVPTSTYINTQIDSLPQVKQLREAIQQNEVLLGQIEATAKQGRASSSYINTENALRSQRGQLTQLRTETKGLVLSQITEMDKSDLERDLKVAQTELNRKNTLLATLNERYQELRTRMSAEGSKKLELDFASQDHARALSLLATISERTAQVTAELGAPGRVNLFRQATPNYIPTKPIPYELLGATTLASLVIPFGIAFLWENSVRRINTVEQLESKTNREVIGEVSRLPARTGRRQAVGHDLGLFEESIDSLRTSLLLANDESEMQILSVCSAVSGEGKTSVSSQLAVSIARSTGQPILLIDGDMRAPDIHQIFDIPLSPGLADVLDGEVSLEKAINREWSEHVHLLPAGELMKSPHKLLGNSALRSLLDEARLWYRYIVIDTPPVLAASESLVIAKQSDRTIVCAMRDFSRESHVRMAHERLHATGAETLGTVLNGVPVRSYASRYGSYGRYGYTEQSSN